MSPASQKAKMRSDCIRRGILELVSAQSMGDQTSKDNLVYRGSKTQDRDHESTSPRTSSRKQHRSCNPMAAGNALRAYEHISRSPASQARQLRHLYRLVVSRNIHRLTVSQPFLLF